MTDDWSDLGDDELLQRLLNRDIAPGLARLMVEDRDCCAGCQQRISNALGAD